MISFCEDGMLGDIFVEKEGRADKIKGKW